MEPLVSAVYNAIRKVPAGESRGTLFPNNALHGIDFHPQDSGPSGTMMLPIDETQLEKVVLKEKDKTRIV